MARQKKIVLADPSANTWDVVNAANKDGKFDEGDYNPPKYSDFKGKNLVGQDMTQFFLNSNEKNMKNADFTGADLSGADFTGFNLQGSIFKNAKLTGTIFLNADVRWSDFRGSNYPEAIWAEFDEDGTPVNRADQRETVTQ